ncbi:MAG: ABC transporter ATP-binding protein [Alphaproteobacteria bacterium]|nr:ABC transporter ATP-binding protein [Alphaproteobacteria bacterium]
MNAIAPALAAIKAPPLCELHDIRKEYVLRRGLLERFTRPERRVAAVDGVSLAIPQGRIFGLVGESGCGKSTLGQIMVRLIEPTSGTLLYRGNDVSRLPPEERHSFRHRVQMVFQDTSSSLNPRKRIRRALGEAIRAREVSNGIKTPVVQAEMTELMRQVGLDVALLGRFPHELSGGQRQRIGIARALAMKPELLIADEPVSSLDVSLQGQIINLLQDLNDRLNLTIVLVSHDLAVVARICAEIAVMKEGKIVEQGPPRTVLGAPSHAYTRTLLSSIPRGLVGRSRYR